MHRKSVVILFIMILTSAAVMGCSHTDGENNKHVMIETMSMTEKETPSETEQYIEITLPEVTVKDEPETVTQAETVDCSQLLDGPKRCRLILHRYGMSRNSIIRIRDIPDSRLWL